MKSFLLLLSTILILGVAQNTYALSTVVCTEIKPKTATAVEVVIKELEDVTNKIVMWKAFDSVKRVEVTISEITSGKTSQVRTFEAFALSEDVVVEIHAIRKNGFSFWQYLDEENQDGADIVDGLGVRKTYRLNCQLK